MKDSFFCQENFFIPAFFLSVSIHGILIGAGGWIPSVPRVSIIEAPSSLEITVVNQPVVSVIEKEIAAEEVFEKDAFGGGASGDRVQKTVPARGRRPLLASRVSRGAVVKAKPLAYVNPAPPYPRIARQRGWEGIVRLKVFIEKDGIASHVGVQESSGYGILDRAALRTVENWKFSPAQSGSLRFSSIVTIPIQFILIKKENRHR